MTLPFDYSYDVDLGVEMSRSESDVALPKKWRCRLTWNEKDVSHPFMTMILTSVTMVGWSDVPDSDRGDFRRRRAVGISSFVTVFKIGVKLKIDHHNMSAGYVYRAFLFWLCAKIIKMCVCFFSMNKEDFERLRPICYPNTDVFLLCFDVGNRISFECLDEVWVPELCHHCPEVPVVLIGCKEGQQYGYIIFAK